MDHREAGRYWDDNANAWTALARAGYDTYRDQVNTPQFLDMLPDVAGLSGLDIGCGEGHNTRLVARRGARMTAVDVSPRFVRHASKAAAQEAMTIRCCAASGIELPFGSETFDFATSFMCLMDIPESELALCEAWRVLKRGGFLQYSILHPCSDVIHRKNLRDADGRTYALELGGYFDATCRIEEWLFSAAPKDVRAEHAPFRIPAIHRTLSDWLNDTIAAGFTVEEVREPSASDAVVEVCPGVQDTQVMPYFLHIRCRKR